MLTVVDAQQNTYAFDVDASIEVENFKAVVEADTDIPAAHQQLLFQNAPLTDAQKSLAAYGVQDGDLLVLRDTRQRTQTNPPDTDAAIAEAVRAQIRGSSNPALLEAAMESQEAFARTLALQREQLNQVQSLQQLANSDPFDVEAQKRIEEAIRQEQIAENMEHAMEYTPEAFGNVTMLYVDLKVNGHPVKAFVDSGAQATIISPECAERCGIMRLLDKRFSGVAKGVGTAKILGRVHSTQIQLGGDLFLPCAFTVLEGSSVDMLFGLDMLKRYQANIDLRKNALIIHDKAIPFLAEHELPKNHLTDPEHTSNSESKKAEEPSSSGGGRSQQQPNATSGTQTQKPQPTKTNTWSDEAITTLTNLGIDRNLAIQLLNASDGNTDIAASIYFQNM
ncbi:DNA damage-inducible protein 1 [Malassezia brasiliensis]|uniref:DNA damage-inducible protein 1 n=1 Tax=Malassezia brasiliensis TaxID=1821822 RepID=A0AAF0DVC1_9BASI|nr:DNA damage-inducible protein 1 [Malassezia brasiliensis]